MRVRTLACVLLSSACFACTGIPEGVDPVRGFDADRYLGTWYEIARFDHRFERGLTDISATYTRREDGGIDVRNRGFDAESGEWREAIGRAYFRSEPSVASLKVSFFGPFYGGYHVVALDREDYEYALVCGPTRDYLWILAREPSLPEARKQALVERASALGFDTSQFIWVEHTLGDSQRP